MAMDIMRREERATQVRSDPEALFVDPATHVRNKYPERTEKKNRVLVAGCGEYLRQFTMGWTAVMKLEDHRSSMMAALLSRFR